MARARARTLIIFILVGGVCCCHETNEPTVSAVSPAAPAAQTPAAQTPAATTPAAKPITQFPILSFEAAVDAAVNEVFTKAVQALAEAGFPRTLTIDPLIDGVTAVQTVATRSMQARIADRLRNNFPQFDVRPFTSRTLAELPLVLIGTLTALDAEGRTGAGSDSYRIWLTLIDLRSATIIAKARARTQPEAVDAAPTPHFRDSPVWTHDRASGAYIQTCHEGKVGGSIPSEYLDGLLAAALVSDAIEAYDAGGYQDALDLYTSARDLPGGDQLRVYNGIYLANWKLGRSETAARAFADIIDHGLRSRQLAVKFLFKPGSTAFWPDPQVSAPYGLWLEQIARQASGSASCLEITGHTSHTGPEPLNERLSLLRAEYIKLRLERVSPLLHDRTIANGRGSRENLIGTGTDDAADALDRRVEFKVLTC